MTDEEKANKYADECFKGNDKDSQYYRTILIKGYLDGLEEGKPKWHDLRKDKTDRPIKDCDVALKVYNYRNHEILRDIGFYKMKEDMFYHYKSACKILAWCEIPKFEEEMNGSSD